ncbi:MAG: cation acetate symporter [Verrucomicrobia bacterium]|nr:cation acetate symporter [Verrucomicrobiota bacterium]
MGFWSARKSKTASDFFVAGRSVSVGWNASAISGEYLSAASFMGVAGMVMSSGYDALWYPVCYACGYLFLLLFIAGPLRRFGAYTIPDFAEGRFDSPVFRKIAVIFVLFIGFFYTMPQMKGAGTTLAYIFPGLPYWAGVVLVGAVITLNVALGGMKGITLVQAFQYWAKMFAISVPIFVLMAVYGHYGKHLGSNTSSASTATYTDRRPLPEKAPKDLTWLNPFGPLTTKAAKAAAAALTNSPPSPKIALRSDLSPDQRMTVHLTVTNLSQALAIYGDLTGRQSGPHTNGLEKLDDLLRGQLSRWSLIQRSAVPDSGVRVHGDGQLTANEVKEGLEAFFKTNGVALVPEGARHFRVEQGNKSAQQAWLDKHERPLALLYTYSLIIALVCGTAGLPHILVRFYTNPDGVAAKRTTMWVMILIGVFYLFPPIFGVLGRNLLPDLYAGVGAKGTDKIVLELPRILNEKYGVLGSVMSGITCAGAFAAFMSTFSGLLVSMTGALAHDVYGRMLRPKSTSEQRLKAFKIAAVVVGSVAIVLGMQVEPFQINFMVGQAFAIAAASYFPLLFMSAWWRGMTTKGAAAGMLGGGVLALAGITLTSFSDLNWLPLAGFWAAHPLLRILCEQPAIWTVPLAIGLMIVVSTLTKRDVPSDVRMKMLVLHAPEKLGLKQEYIQEHQAGH